MTPEDLLPQSVVLEADRFGGFVVAVNDGRHISIAASLACGPLAGTRARRSLERDKLRHGIVSEC